MKINVILLPISKSILIFIFKLFKDELKNKLLNNLELDISKTKNKFDWHLSG